MSWPIDAYVGQKVAAVATPNEIDLASSVCLPPKGSPVTISWIGIGPAGCVLIDLIEYPNEGYCTAFRGYFASAFRPFKERKTDISIFTAMLGPKQKETLDA